MDTVPAYVTFYSAKEQPYGCFSNFSAHGFTLNGQYWATTEHYFQAQKFAGTHHAEEIRLAKSPTIAARMGRSRQRPLRPDWESIKDDVMREGLLRKFETHTVIRAVLLGTGNAVIVENAPSDYYWGCGANGSGKNRLGTLLMEIREQLAAIS